MYCDLRSAISEGATNIKPPAALNRLPPASQAVFPGLFTWAPISTSALTAALNLDRGLWATWRSRRLTPAPMPPAWFRRAPGAPLNYRVDHVLVWLAARRGDQLDTLTTWRLSLARDLDTDVSDPEEVRRWALTYARAAGPVVGDVRFTPAGLQAYLASLLSS
ncbi:hypothetical protein PMNALOAF_4103 [Methylobacterium adhaesivum]|nr:hypothetical protein PMNALOAF_4103 [Methylobacterium adhaesivum]